MIPTYLSVRNFMCYREPVELDLRGIRVACLSGDNGAGKSALLDSITWALWGKARVNSDRDLLALGETEMEVTFGFLLNDQEFRVTRRRTRRGAGPLMLELQVRDGDAWRSLSGATVRETQQAIDNLLRIDYDTFINSAFILQGRADEFTTRTPANRKQVLGEILNLSDYDRFEELARRELRRREQQLHDIEADLVEIDGRLAELPRHEAEVEALSQELLALGDQAEARGERLAATQARLQELE
ncbi:MAG: SMC family ATPase, partial [Thermomicrobiaceae bacterium]|nr:SMC family ATPase [Thermomicrobiaceae bacterium]